MRFAGIIMNITRTSKDASIVAACAIKSGKPIVKIVQAMLLRPNNAWNRKDASIKQYSPLATKYLNASLSRTNLQNSYYLIASKIMAVCY